MQLHQLKPTHRRKKQKRIGRGGKRGTYSGRGIKGQKARAGATLQPAIRVFIKRYPKLRGYKQKPKIQSLKFKTVILNLDVLEKNFSPGEKITPKVLLDKGIIHKIKGRIPNVKILGRGEITKKLIIEGCEASKTARDKIEKVGGTIEM